MTETLPGLLIQTIADSVHRAAAEPSGRAIGPREFAALARYCDYILRESEAGLADVAELLAEGVEAGAFRRRCEEELEALGRVLDLTANILQLASRVAPPSREDATVVRSVESLERVRQGLSDVRANLLQYLAVVNRPRPTVDWRRLADEARADREAGLYVRYETAEGMAHDLAGG